MYQRVIREGIRARLYRIVAENITGSCGMMPSLALRVGYESILESVAEGVSESN